MITQIVVSVPNIPILSLAELEAKERANALDNRVFFATKLGSEPHILLHEPHGGGGYIFRSIDDPQMGHSGHHDTITKAVRRVFELKDWQVHSFASFAEAAAHGMFK